MPVGKIRDKVLYGLGKARGRVHRYTWWRWAVGITFTLAVAALPLSGTMRFDFWRGNHVVLGEVVDLPMAAKAFAFPFLGINVAIIVASRFIGRYLCGFVCPYGALARLLEWFRFRSKSLRERLLGNAALLAICALMGAIVFVFWVDWRVLVEGSPRAIAVSSAFFVVTTLSMFFGVRLLGLRFCRDWCPSGVYFALLGHETSNAVEFEHPEACTECKACEKVCPVGLHPTELSGGAWRGGSGLYSDTMSNFSLCLRCGDCVVACEGTTARGEVPTPLRMGWLPSAARDSVDRTKSPAVVPRAGDPVEGEDSGERPPGS